MSNSSSPESSQTCLDLPEEEKENEGARHVLSLANLRVLEPNDQIRELQTIVRDSNTSRSDFLFFSDRLIRLVVEEGLNCLPSYKCTVTTPTGCEYEGEWFEKMNCAVSILRSGEAMEKVLRNCCRSIRIGKILIRRDQDTKKPRVYYAKFPPQIEKRKVLLLLPVLAFRHLHIADHEEEPGNEAQRLKHILCKTGATILTALKVLKDHGVHEGNVVLVSLFCTPKGAHTILTGFPNVTLLTSEVHECCPSYFAQKYFGSD